MILCKMYVKTTLMMARLLCQATDVCYVGISYYCCIQRV